MRYAFGNCVLDTARRELHRDGALVPLEPKGYQVLLSGNTLMCLVTCYFIVKLRRRSRAGADTSRTPQPTPAGAFQRVRRLSAAHASGRGLLPRIPLLAAVFILLTGGTALADAAFLATPTRLDFGEVPIGVTSPEQTVTITNVSAAPLIVHMTGGTTRDPSFTGVQNCAGVTLAPGQSCQSFFTFKPLAPGPVADTAPLTLQGVPPSGGNPTPEQTFAIDVSGIGLAPGATPTRALLITPTRFDFGEVQIGKTSPTQAVVITNVSASPVVLTQLAGGGTNLFDATQDCANVTLAPDQSCHFFYAFTPGALGPVTETTLITANGRNVEVELAGTGIEASAAALPFATFNVLVAEARPPRKTFSVSVLLSLGADSNGIDPTTEAVTLVAGQFSMTIPPGSFRRLRNGALVFTSRALSAAIRPLGGSLLVFSSLVNGASPGAGPADVSLTMGDDGGNTASVEPIVVGQ